MSKTIGFSSLTRAFATAMVLALSLSLTAAPASAGDKVQRVQFQRGRTSSVIKGQLHNNSITYVLGAREGQTLIAHLVNDTNNDAVFTIDSPSGTSLIGEEGSNYDTDWSGTLPETGDYRINVSTIESKSASFTLEITIR